MKEKTAQTKLYLAHALRSLPDDFALQAARSHIRAALSKICEVDVRRQRRQEVAEEEADRQAALAAGLQPWQMTLPQARRAVHALDRMIAEEMAKLAELQQRPRTPSQPVPPPPGTLLG